MVLKGENGMKVIRGLQVRMYPNDEQKKLIDNTIGCCRFVYNQTLVENLNAYKKTGHGTKPNDRIKRLVSLKDENPWLKEVEASALAQAVRDFNKNLDRYIKNPTETNYPKFKSKRFAKQSYRAQYFNNGRTDIKDSHHIRISKIGLVATKLIETPETYRLRNITVVKTKTNKYYAKLCIETETNDLVKTGRQAGFYFGQDDTLISSDGLKIQFPRFAEKSYEYLAKNQRKLSKMRTKLEKAGVNCYKAKNYIKQKRKVAKIYEHIANQKKDFNHKLSRKLVEDYDLLAFDDTNIDNVVDDIKKRYDVAYGSLIRSIRYKSLWYGKKFITVNQERDITKNILNTALNM